ncbi:hypothetical protein CFE70_000901 [Pyrenophora teres f. teres 0-1]|uniref:Uncharacterized protein n=2 Tax=Pyrenophora teres f. teres TaxID=97479 RepID=E3RYN6_PYRTT|nr:hypothetical protein PTT_14677 [Pyrenophora teres f. teres 0-1]KAE8824422.1 hypothetical protein HRS9122_10356 [Pyrenophora teres f. teres]KAE8835817.1 hypothetical protein HRS9139_03915 [Pyrenophora teres f. teres]KAE8838210.1 hypothetical protein PTNB85_05545 [Pyrenophora teres f. teres]KAE8863038.1 hypothetical protein PTNB29_05600 [Pyrenophora teres f. teres]
MSDVDQKTAGTPFASGAAWSESEKIAYLLVLCENGGKIDAKISNAPIPAGRTVVSCKMLLVRLRKKYGEDMVKIKNGQILGGKKSHGNRKRKHKHKSEAAKGETDMDSDDAAEGSPKKKANIIKEETFGYDGDDEV